MPETEITLFVGLRQGTRIDLETAANASLAWAVLIKAVGQQVDPFTEWSVELESSLPGSLKIRSIIRLGSAAEKRGAIKGAVLVSLFFIFKEAASWGVSEILDYLTGPDAAPEARDLSEDDRQQIAKDVVSQLQRDAYRAEVANVYEALERDEKVTGAGATANPSGQPSIVIPRQNFPSRDTADEDDPKTQRIVTEEIDLLLIRPVLTTDTSRRWGFQSRYGTFGAPIRDQAFLSALAEGRLDVPMSQGIRMIVEIEITEEESNGIWKPTERIITRVIGSSRRLSKIVLA